MEKEKLGIIRDELIKFIQEKNFGNGITPLDSFEVMNNIRHFLDPDAYEENIKVLNSIKK